MGEEKMADVATDVSTLAGRMVRHKTGLTALSFAEATIVPIPLEALIVPLMIGHPARAFFVAFFVWIGCLVGASLFYVVGFWLAEPIINPTLAWLNLTDDFNEIADQLSQEGLFWTVLLISLLPAPMQLATLGAGTVGGNYLVFVSAIALSRGIRYFGLALMAQLLGEQLQRMNIPKKKTMAVTIAVALIIWGTLQIIDGI